MSCEVYEVSVGVGVAGGVGFVVGFAFIGLDASCLSSSSTAVHSLM